MTLVLYVQSVPAANGKVLKGVNFVNGAANPLLLEVSAYNMRLKSHVTNSIDNQ